MNTKTTFEDRLPAELQDEIELRETSRAEGAEPAAQPAARRRLVTPPRARAGRGGLRRGRARCGARAGFTGRLK
ncbi:hypothetical protein [Streptomyces sp. SAS_270]|uniref:hypothetical protein n=1 Tax=Streptomyces sp. SAS_270 TaxID=3412748 RepID=UPI00403C6FB3